MKYENRKYLNWLKSQPCVVCNRVPCDPAHQPSPWNGVGMKSPDTYCLPLCRECHEKEHRTGHDTFWATVFNEPGTYFIKLMIRDMCLAHFTRFLAQK
jgi:hypothetical protein